MARNFIGSKNCFHIHSETTNLLTAGIKFKKYVLLLLKLLFSYSVYTGLKKVI